MKKKNKLHSLNHLNIAYVIIAVVAMLVVATSVIFFANFRNDLYEQRVFSLSQTSEKIVQMTDNVIDTEWERLAFASREINRETQDSKDTLFSRLEDFYRVDSQSHELKIGCIDSDGITYKWDGSTGRWEKPSMLLEGQPKFQVSIIDGVDDGAEQMVFLYTLPSRIPLVDEGIELTHTLSYVDMDYFDQSLEVKAFGDTSYTYITENNGTTLYHQQNQGEFISAYNIVNALENVKFLYDGSYEKLKEKIDENTSYVGEIQIEGKNYFVAYSTLQVVEKWNLFLFVPESSIDGSTADMLWTMLVELGIIAILITLMISLFVWHNSRQTLEKQQLAVEEARKASEAKTSFLSHMSHDIRTPLNGIIGMCHIAEKNIKDEEALTDCLEKIDLSSRQLMALINDVLDMSRIEHGNIEISHTPVDIFEIIRICSVHTEVLIGEKGITFKKDTTGVEHSIVSTDEVVIEKILTNILGNASKFTKPGGSIELTVSELNIDDSTGLYRFEIKDNGVGMSKEFAKHLFEPFVQENVGSRTEYQGTGLGLAIVKSLVDKLGGFIEVNSETGKGSTFIIHLPLEYSNEEAFVAKTSSNKAYSGVGHKALLVEDNELNCMIAKSMIEECGLEVDVASNGKLALEQFESSPVGTYDVIFMDVRMPVMDGLEACRRIRQLDRKDAISVPIIAVSADAFKEDIEKAKKAGMNDQLSKPIDIHKLRELLSKYCVTIKKDAIDK